MNPNYPHNTNVHTTGTHGTHGYNQPGYVQPGTTYTTGTTGYVQPGVVHTGPTYTTTTTTQGVYSNHPGGYTRGETYKWNNPYGLNVPIIAFTPGCKKCNGTGTCKSRFSGTPLPCTRCYTRQGYCKKCYGTGTTYRKGKPCTKCTAGKRMNNKSSSSSDSN